MRGTDRQTGKLFSYASPESLVPRDHPLRAIRLLVNAALDRLSPAFQAIYAEGGRPSIAPEKLLRALLLQALFSIRSERQLMQQITYNMLFRWFTGLAMDVPVWDVTVFTKHALGPAKPDPGESRPPAGRRHRARLPGGDPRRSEGHAAALDRAFFGGRHTDRSLGLDEELPPERRQRRAARTGPQ